MVVLSSEGSGAVSALRVSSTFPQRLWGACSSLRNHVTFASLLPVTYDSLNIQSLQFTLYDRAKNVLWARV